MKKMITTVLMTSVIALPAYAIAQDSNLDRWQWEVRAEVAEPTRNLSNTDLETGVAFQGTVSVTLAGGFGMYTGLDLQTAHADSSFAGQDVAFNQNGFLLGVQWQNRFASSNLGLRLRAGAVYGEISISEDDHWNDEIANSSHGLGWEAGIALTIGLPNKWMLTPGIRYRELSRNLQIGGVNRDVDLESVIIGVGFSRTF